ncbi:MAG: ArsR family transcriptional regulator [Thermoplasmata archaeon]|nr:ArsR family transcriptional regulator [Thermoplasmata archaeon]
MKGEKDNGCVLTSVIESEIKILKRHIDILKAVIENEPVGIIKLSEATDYPQHTIRYSLRILEQEGIIEPSSRGAVTTKELEKLMKSLKKSLSNIRGDLEEISKSIE